MRDVNSKNGIMHIVGGLVRFPACDYHRDRHGQVKTCCPLVAQTAKRTVYEARSVFNKKKLQLPCVFLSTPPAASGTSGKTDPSGPVEYSSMHRKRAADQRRHVEQAPIVVPTTTATTILLIITAACNMHLNIHIGINIKIMCRQGRALPATCLVV